MLHPGAPSAAAARLALLLLDAQLMPQRLWVRSQGRLEKACKESLREWIEGELGSLHLLCPAFGVRIAAAPGNDGVGDGLSIGWWAEHSPEVVIGPAVVALEAGHAGLGKAALQALHSAGWNSFPVFTFDNQLDIAEWLLWGGEDDAEHYAESVGMAEEDRDGFLTEAVRRSQILEQTPEDMLRLGYGAGDAHASIRAIKRRAKDTYARRIAELVLEMRAIGQLPWVREHHSDCADSGGEFAGFAAVARWSDSDYTSYLREHLEYSANYEWGTGYGDCGACELRLDDLDGFKGLLSDLRQLFVLTRMLDELLWRLSYPQWLKATREGAIS